MFVPMGDEHTLAQWEDKFFGVLQEKEELARRVVKLSNDLRNIKAKSTRFENTIRQKNRLDKEDSHTITSRPKKFDRDEKEFIEDLKLRNHNLQKDNKKLEEKLRTVIQVLKKYKRQVQTLKLRHDSGPHVRQRGDRGNGTKIGVSDSSSEQFESDVKNVMGQLQQRLVHTEEELRNLEKENQKLKRHHNESRSDVPTNYNATNHEIHTSYLTMKEELNEARVRIKLLEVKYANLETKSQEQIDLQQETRQRLKECNDHIIKLRDELKILRQEKKAAFKEARMAEEHRDQVEELMEENKFLEEKFTKLCEIPFEQEDHSSTEEHLKEHILDMESQNASLKDEINGLREINNEQAQLNRVSQDLMKKWKDNFMEVENQVENCIQTHGKMHFDLTALKEKKIEHGSDKGVQFNGATVGSVSVQTEPTQPETPEKNQEGKKGLSMERLRSMLNEQVARNKELQTKVNEVKHEETETVNKIVSKFDRLQLLASQKLDQIRKMEQQEERDEKLGRREYLLSDSDSSETSPEEMMLVLSLQNAHLSEHVFPRSCRTMLTVDLLNHETKCSPIGVGKRPNFDFSNRYKIVLNSYTLEQLDQGTAAVELCLYTVSQKTTLVANAFVSLKHLMETVNQTHQIDLSALNRNRDHIGSIRVKATLLDRSVSEDQRSAMSYDSHVSKEIDNQLSNSTMDVVDPYMLAVHSMPEKQKTITRDYDSNRSRTSKTITVNMKNFSTNSPDPFMVAHTMSGHQGTTRGYNNFFSQKTSRPNTPDSSTKENISVDSVDPYMYAAHSKSADDNTFTYNPTTESQRKTASKKENVVDDASSLDSFYYM